MSITEIRLKEILEYSPESGIFTWKIDKSWRAKEGYPAGGLDSSGYVGIKIDSVLYKSHRLAFLYMNGAWPREHVDHINGIRSDNRWDNLREANQNQNMHNTKNRVNNTSGVKGVTLHRLTGKWQAQIQVNGYHKYLGLFEDKGLAEEFVNLAREMLHGEYANHGRKYENN